MTDKMEHTGEYLYVLRPVRPEMMTDGPTDEEGPVLESHYQYLKALAEEGVVRLAGRTATDTEDAFGLVVFHADSPDDARQIMDQDPAVTEGVMTAELHPYRIAVEGG